MNKVSRYYDLNLPEQADHFLGNGIENPHDNDEHSVKAKEWKVLSPAAATWLKISGKAIFGDACGS